MLKATEHLIGIVESYNCGTNIDDFLLKHSVSNAVIKDLLYMIAEFRLTSLNIKSFDSFSIECPCCHTKYTISANELNKDKVHCLECGHEYNQHGNIYKATYNIKRFKEYGHDDILI